MTPPPPPTDPQDPDRTGGDSTHAENDPAPSEHGSASSGEAPRPTGPRRRGTGPSPALVAAVLFLLVLLLALAGFFGVRAALGEGDRSDQAVAAAVPELLPAGQATSSSI